MVRRIIRVLNASLKPVEAAYRKLKDVLRKTKNRVPNVFSEIEVFLKNHFISIESGKSLRNSPNFGKLSETIAANIAKKIPYIDEGKLDKIIMDKSSSSFLDMLTIGLGKGEHKEFTKIKKEKLFKKILIANRGEIALRVIRACREMGISTVQVYTKPDAKSLSVKFADKSVKLGNEASAYLDMHKIIKIAKKLKVDAIHPGYGFLSENADFAKLCKENKVKFIGPSHKIITAMGDKVNARKLVKKEGIPALEGTDHVIVDAIKGMEIAKSIGFPVIIKAAAGGGGRGMRVVKNEAEFESCFAACQAEAESSFKNKDVFIEKYLLDPRHIEFQILADSKGNVIHLGERDCSIQRRHQKLLEEAPSPAMNPELRERMGEAALKIAKAIGYEGAGTIEFLLDNANNFHFIEMNTRIQVEHGITEMITGIDLVREQIKIAAGGELSRTQADVEISGWAIECRINAECPTDGFCPVTGTIVNYLPPGGPGIRVCSSCHAGQEVNPHYDSMLAKLMCWGETRTEAMDKMQRALNEFIIEGIDTTIPFHRVVLTTPAFIKGDITTSFIEKNHIMERVKKESKKKILTKEEKAVIITTAVSGYMNKNRFNDKQGAWVKAARQEAVFQE